ncbi:testis development-related protein [Carlito syrichta]|uniref:Testis development-related protein n=1 Tax=Carlito syrichta TaxID=1868482 RepID=A0A1U7U4A5_CARSF|nr:testis development-related protein [Carlito syrichta]
MAAGMTVPVAGPMYCMHRGAEPNAVMWCDLVLSLLTWVSHHPKSGQDRGSALRKGGTFFMSHTHRIAVLTQPCSVHLRTMSVSSLGPLELSMRVALLAVGESAQVQGTSFRGWKEVTSLFNKDDEQHLLERCKSPRSKGTTLRLKEESKTEKKSGFWDNLVLKQNMQSKKPDEIEGWEPPKLALEDVSPGSEDAVDGHPTWPGWEGEAKGSTKYISLTSSAGSSRWSLRSAGKLVSLRRQSKGHLTDSPEEAE